jgi:hypothetical protein
VPRLTPPHTAVRPLQPERNARGLPSHTPLYHTQIGIARSDGPRTPPKSGPNARAPPEPADCRRAFSPSALSVRFPPLPPVRRLSGLSASVFFFIEFDSFRVSRE